MAMVVLCIAVVSSVVNRWSVGLLAVDVAADGPDGFLREDVLERRHVDAAVARAALHHGAEEVLVHLGHAGLVGLLGVATVGVELAQVGRDAAGLGLQPVAARAIGVVG